MVVEKAAAVFLPPLPQHFTSFYPLDKGDFLSSKGEKEAKCSPQGDSGKQVSLILCVDVMHIQTL